MAERIEALVARVVSDNELILNKGAEDGVEQGMIFDVIDERTREVRDPVTGENLGSLDRRKARVSVIDVGTRICLVRNIRKRGTVVLGSRPRNILDLESWPEGVTLGDSVVFVGERVTA